MEDIQEEIDFWSSSIICYVVGSNSPIQVVEGYLRRVWKYFNIDKVAMVKGIYHVRFNAMDSQDKVLEGYYFFDKNLWLWNPIF